MMKKMISAVLLIALSGTLTVPALAAGPTFTDVPQTHWAYTYIEAAADAGIVTGVGNNRYNPSGTVSTAEFGTMITRAFRESSLENELHSYETRNDGLSMYTKYTDSDKWWAPYMECMNTGGLLAGTTVEETGGTYRNKWTVATVEAGISRYDMAMVIYNLMNALYTDFEAPSSSEMNAAKSDISDWSSIPAKYQDAVAACYAEGYLSGVDATGRFNGSGTMDRAQGATVMYRLLGLGDGVTTNPGTTTTTNTQTGTAVGEKDAQGHTTANSVNSVHNRNKSDAYPTTGNSETVSNNGYYTGANINIGDATLVYDFLDMVNKARRAEGLHELQWVQSDAAEEYTLVRAYEASNRFTHDRADGTFATEVLAWGAGNAEGMFQSWMDSAGHRQTLMNDSENCKYVCAAKCGATWVITMWTDIQLNTLNYWTENDYVQD